MYSAEQLNIRLDKGEEVVVLPGQKFKNFGVIVQNIGGSYLPKVEVILSGPDNVRIPKIRENLGGIPSGKKKKGYF